MLTKSSSKGGRKVAAKMLNTRTPRKVLCYEHHYNPAAQVSTLTAQQNDDTRTHLKVIAAQLAHHNTPELTIWQFGLYIIMMQNRVGTMCAAKGMGHICHTHSEIS